MPKNKWKITKTSLTNKPVLSKYNEYIDLDKVLEEVLKCKGLDLCTYEEEQALLAGKWKKETFAGISGATTETLSSTLDSTHAYLVQRFDVATGIMYYTAATASGTTLTIGAGEFSGPYSGITFSYTIFYKATA